MGVDALPLQAKSAASLNHYSVEDSGREVKMTEKGRRSRKGKTMGAESFYCERSEKLKRREHPQEEELQMFKRDFQAWRAARFDECCRAVDSGKGYLPLIHAEQRVAEVMKGNVKQREHGLMDDLRCDSEHKDKLFTRTRSFGREFNLPSDRSPTKIVVLKPLPHRFHDNGDSLITSSRTMGGSSRGSIEEFLEEVKDCLESELQGRALEGNTKKRVHVGRRLKETGEISKADSQKSTRGGSFRSSNGTGFNDVEDRVAGKKDSSSPRNLIRSLSAPVSGKSFGKLLLEDRHVLTGSEIRRKHEAAEQEPPIEPTRRKKRFNFRKKVSNFRSTLRGRIFGKKIRSMMIESNSSGGEYIKDFVPCSNITSFYHRNENSTEVPPSPVSVFSCNPEEFWINIDDLSPVSTSEALRDFGSNLSEVRRQIKELESDKRDDTHLEQEANHEPPGFTNMDKAFVRDLLAGSGLYYGTSDEEHISKSVFQETEKKLGERTERKNSENRAAAETDHSILFDLLNEALAVVLGRMETKPSFRRKPMDSSGWIPPRGRYLLEETWQIMSEHLYVQTDKPFCSLDGTIAWDLGSSSWAGLIDEEVKVLGREVEDLIMADLVEDLLL